MMSIVARNIKTRFLVSGIKLRRNFLSAPILSSLGCADVIKIPLFTDNYCYLIVDRETKHAAVVDPGTAQPVIKIVEQLQRDENLELKAILCTHKHHDHVGGNAELKHRFPTAEVIGTGYEHIPSIDRPVRHGDSFRIGSLQVRTIFTPCHTSGHVCFFVTSAATPSHFKGTVRSGEVGAENMAPMLFSGDTLFAGGCGRFFEGTAEDMLRNMDLLLALPQSSHVYFGHEYTLSNLEFLCSLAPRISSPPLQLSLETYLMRAKVLRQDSVPTAPSTLADEMAYNLFVKCREAEVQRMVGCEGDPVATMQALRELKNSF